MNRRGRVVQRKVWSRRAIVRARNVELRMLGDINQGLRPRPEFAAVLTRARAQVRSARLGVNPLR